MGTTLTGTTPQDTYDSLIKVTDNGPLSGTLKALSDGLGNDSVLAISTASTSITAASGAIGLTLANSSGGTKVDFTVTENTGLSIDFNESATARSLNLLSAGTSRLFIENTGNVGIGTSSPVSKLNVNGVISASAGAQSNPTGGASIVVDYQTTSDLQGRVRSRDWDGGLWKNLRLEGENIIVSPSGTEVGRFTSNGLTFNGDTAAANALDDYEEGTWTMGISFGGASAGVSYSSNTGTYTKIGRQVTVNGFVRLTNKGSSTGAVKITGLPFTITNNGENYSAASIRFDKITFTDQFQAYGDINTTQITLEEITTLGVRTTITDADFANDSAIILSFTYFV